MLIYNLLRKDFIELIDPIIYRMEIKKKKRVKENL